ncbi:LOW QUALITY PROTEIN: hypothetical protein SORBI_3010G157100 [Sorghum bicolor]|uniref:RING-type E3 ubiquitin transferase n=1 Tax=Sorghum bicolor TaxID=4558 RepID=A0A1W0VTC0_SORBI|nr:LOW QUALITY PROTEIN: hypothetical protein SORBI_3010G157100 [Sorghum bicolor]
MHRASMPSVHRSRLLAAGHAAPAPDEADVRLCSVLLASFLSLMLLCGVLSLLSRASGDGGAFPTKVYVIVGPTAIMLVLVFLCWLVSYGIRALATPPQAPAPARLARRLCACGLSDAASVAALPAFPFQPAPAPAPASEGEGEGEGERQAPPRGSGVLCAVCLEDVRAGEMLPACRHVFHVDCVDVWLRSHRTCPLCRCELPRRKATAQAQQTVTTVTPEALPLPPV